MFLTICHLEDTFLQINDSINTVLNRYEAFKKGDYSVAANPIPAELGPGSSRQNDLSLIDFDDPAPSKAQELTASDGPELLQGISEQAGVPQITEVPELVRTGSAS